MKPINQEKFSVNSMIWLRNLQWRRKKIFFGGGRGTLRPLKGYQAAPAGGPGGKGPPRTIAKFHFLK